MIEPRLAETLKRIVNRALERHIRTVSLAQFSERYNLGRIAGNTIHFTAFHRDEIRGMLTTQGVDLSETIDLKSMERVERLNHSPHEKAGGGKVKSHRISVKAMNGKGLRIDGYAPIVLPPESHLDIQLERIAGKVLHDSIVLVENYQNFDRLHQADIVLPPHLLSPVAVYRGDVAESRMDAVMRFIESCSVPVLAYVDIDPAGLVNISRLPRLKGVIAPTPANLEPLLSSTATRRADLYDAQYAGCHAVLDGLPEDHPCKALWELVKKHRAGVVQERFITMGLRCVLWG